MTENENVNNMIASSQAATLRNAVCGVGTSLEQSAAVGAMVGIAQGTYLMDAIVNGVLSKPMDVADKDRTEATARARKAIEETTAEWGEERDRILAAAGLDRNSIKDPELAGLLTFVGTTTVVLKLAELVGPIRERARQRIGALLAAASN